MTQLKRLLAATDLSPASRHAAERAAMLGRESGATVELVHVAAVDALTRLRQFVSGVPAEVEERVLDKLHEDISRLAETLRQRYSADLAVHVLPGAAVPTLARAADDLEANLVVLGAHGASLMRQLRLGATADRMLHLAKLPVLVVKQPPRESYQRALVAVDFSPSSVEALRMACALAPTADIALLHAFEVPFEGKLRFAGVEEDVVERYRGAAKQDALGRLRDLAAAGAPASSGVILLAPHGDASLRIAEHAHELDCDLIVLGKHGESRLQELLLGSVTRRVLAESACDVLVVV